MKRTDKYPETNTFHYFNPNPKNRITGDCEIRAYCAFFGWTWREAVEFIAQSAVKNGYWLDNKMNEKFMEEMGLSKQKQPRKADGKKYTVKEFIEQVTEPGKRYFCSIGGHHVACIRDGKLWDIWDSTSTLPGHEKCIGNYWVTKA